MQLPFATTAYALAISNWFIYTTFDVPCQLTVHRHPSKQLRKLSDPEIQRWRILQNTP